MFLWVYGCFENVGNVVVKSSRPRKYLTKIREIVENPVCRQYGTHTLLTPRKQRASEYKNM